MDTRHVGHAIRRRVGAPPNNYESAVNDDDYLAQRGAALAEDHDSGMHQSGFDGCPTCFERGRI
jgi:hypothetical protein